MGSLLQNEVNAWWIQRIRSPCYKAILSLIPTSICWELWLNRNSGRFENIARVADQIVASIKDNVRAILSGHQLLQKRCFADTQILHQLQVQVPVLIVKPWILTSLCLPSVGRHKLNSDGSCKGNLGVGGGGSVIRSEEGHIILAHADYYGDKTNTIAEAKALLQGLQLCRARNIHKVDTEVDSMVIANVIQKKTAVPWAIAYEIRIINDLLTNFDFSIRHIFREANRAADFLANLGCSAQRKIVFRDFGEIPVALRGYVNSDRLGFFNLRCIK